MTREEARERILEVISTLPKQGRADGLRGAQAKLLQALHTIEGLANSRFPEVRAAAQDILRVLGIQADVAEA